MAGQQVREFTVRAAGADRSFQKFVLGKFPLGPPELRAPGASWQKHERDCYVAKLDRVSTKEPDAPSGSGRQWVLHDRADKAVQPLLVGQPEAGMGDGGSGAGYFLLVKHTGKEERDTFLALPVTEWQNFKPVSQRQTASLDEAEAEMKRKRLAVERVNPRLAQAVKAANANDIVVPGDEEDQDSDAEWKDIRARAASRQAIKAAPQRRQAPARGAEDEEEAEREEEDHAEKSDKGEDWEHEDVAADDDVDMGEGEADEGADMSPVRRRRAGSVSSDEEDVVAPAKVSRTLKRMMRQTGLEDSDEEEEEEESDGEEESESIEDEDDLDKMATGLLPGRAKSPSPGAQEAASKKRKALTPPPPGMAAAAAAAGGAAAGRPAAAGGAAAADQQAKRQRTGAAAAAAAPAAPVAAAAAAGPSAAAARPAAATAGAPAAAGGGVASPVAESEIRALLQQHGRLQLRDLAARFKAKLTSNQERNAFTQLVKQIAKLEAAEDGQKYLVLR